MLAMPSDQAPAVTSKKDAKELARQFKEAVLETMPSLLADWLELVRASENPKDYLDYLAFGSKLNGLEPKNDQAAGLPVFHITFANGSVQGKAEVSQAPAIDVVPVEKDPSTPEASDPADPLPQLAGKGEPASLPAAQDPPFEAPKPFILQFQPMEH